MQPNPKFINKSSAFWAYAKLLSEQLGYSKDGVVISYSEAQARAKLKKLGINVKEGIFKDVLRYLKYRAELLNKHKDYLMDVEEARKYFQVALKQHQQNNYTCKLPLNKQKNEKKDYAYFTCIINIIAETELRHFANNNGLVYGKDIYFDDNPMNLSYILNFNRELEGIMSRRFDGAFPSTVNPILIWEIKEYYYTTTFGSRIADGVYETQLDGYEIKTIREETNKNIQHIYFIDDYNTWWNMGKSYLCRIIDMLHMGLVDEVIMGKEVFERWPQILRAVLNQYYK
ncbi:DUF7687 domain-containing protein [Parageobacillus toebii]|jgi:hypothetical protein|uniref:Uncharacterized protein n=1 Tax=Parageobacillus toebii TaxID=153151 RepID=A0A150N7S1_9BACL|nr:hypothetical protein [Parageobacillus toebii]KYD32761.1 hypothetical protein B4110_3591 [Parageobacillus toebii]